jgi:hypothetical protein
MHIAGGKPRAAVGHIVLLLIFGCGLVWYAWDAWSASSRITNTVLILPAAFVGLLLIVGLLLRELRRFSQAPDPSEFARDAEAENEKDRAKDEVRTSMILMALLAAYVGTMDWIGLDVATFLYIAASLVALDERRPLVIIAYSLGFTLVALGAMGQLIQLPETIFLEAILK